MREQRQVGLKPGFGVPMEANKIFYGLNKIIFEVLSNFGDF